jgi:hypothetical protein
VVAAGSERWTATGRSDASASRTAGAAATAQALDGRADPALLIVFFSSGHDAQELLAGARAVAADTPLIGCSTAGEISAAGPGDAGVVVMALGGRGFSVSTAAADAVAGGLREAGATVAAAAADVAHRPYRTSCCSATVSPATRRSWYAASTACSARRCPWSAGARATTCR